MTETVDDRIRLGIVCSQEKLEELEKHIFQSVEGITSEQAERAVWEFYEYLFEETCIQNKCFDELATRIGEGLVNSVRSWKSK